jgi:DNA polymerase I-like protein with 3'-5' exonuclease and polymerase domains
MHALNAYKYIEVNGLPIDIVKLDETHKGYLEERAKLSETLKSYKDIKWNSTKQLSEYLFNELNL